MCTPGVLRLPWWTVVLQVVPAPVDASLGGYSRQGRACGLRAPGPLKGGGRERGPLFMFISKIVGFSFSNFRRLRF